ncbi:MAG TPA: YIP1 family protein [Gemmatimonadaceae bacterium]|nr:YIP1 family protein [Gemmatimonadaceae bacterium]
MTTAAVSKTSSIFEDIVEIFVSPSRVFARRKGRGFWLALLIYTVIVAALAIGTRPLMQPVYDAVWQQSSAQIAKQNPQITPEQLDKARSMQDKFAVAGAIIFTPIMVLLTGFVLWIVGKLFDAEEPLGDATMVATFSFFPKILAVVVGALIAMFTDPSRITSPFSVTVGPGYLIDAMQHPILSALVGRLDLFTIWVTVLLAIGLHVVGKIPIGKAAIAAAIVWVLGALPGLYGAMKMAG